jgi:hypothetical protein
MKRILAIACLLASLAASAATPIVGQKFPDNLNAPDATGKVRNLQSLMGQKGLALFFVRSQVPLTDHGIHPPRQLTSGLLVSRFFANAADTSGYTPNAKVLRFPSKV